MKHAKVYFQDTLAGILTEDENGYTFVYSEAYIADNGMSISLTMPLQTKPITSDNMFPFFDGLIPEGWLLEVLYVCTSFLIGCMAFCKLLTS